MVKRSVSVRSKEKVETSSLKWRKSSVSSVKTDKKGLTSMMGTMLSEFKEQANELAMQSNSVKQVAAKKVQDKQLELKEMASTVKKRKEHAQVVIMTAQRDITSTTEEHEQSCESVINYLDECIEKLKTSQRQSSLNLHNTLESELKDFLSAVEKKLVK